MSDTPQRRYAPGPIDCKGAAFDDFLLTEHLPPEAAPSVIERDRLHMAARPGFERKLLPLRVEPDTGVAYSGGRYLLDTYEDAVRFGDWVANEFELDGVLILDRPDFADVTTHVWHVIGAHDFKDVRTSQHVYRTEIWRTTDPAAGERLAAQWPSLRDAAEEQGRAALWLLYNDARGELSLVTIDERRTPVDVHALDFASLRRLEQAPSLGRDWDSRLRAEKTFDRTHWVFTIWFPVTGAATDRPALWPNSPPLPTPEHAVAAASVA